MEFSSALPYLIAVYVGIWFFVLAYVLIMQNKLSALRKQVEVLTRAVEKKSEKKPEPVRV